MIIPEEIDFLQPGQLWPPLKERGRLERYKNNKLLYMGNHREAFISLLNSPRNDVKLSLDVVANFPRAVTKLFTDLLFVEPPKIQGKEDVHNVFVNEFSQRCQVTRNCRLAARGQSIRGDAVFKLYRIDNKAYLSVIPASMWFPVYPALNTDTPDAHVLAWIVEKENNKNDNGDGIKYLRAEIHAPGVVYQRAYLVDKGSIQRPADLAEIGEESPQQVVTGIDKPLVFVVTNERDDESVYGIGDYDCGRSLFFELDARLSQISRILDKHADPAMTGPALETRTIYAADGTAKLAVPTSGGRYFALSPGMEPPQYITWDAQLSAAFSQVEGILNQLYIDTDTNAAAFSLISGGSVPSGTALKRLLMRPLARVANKRDEFDPVLKEIFTTAAKLEGKVGAEFDITWRDGLPDDPMESAQIAQIRTAGKATASIKSMLGMLDNLSGDVLEEELSLIKEDDSASNPPIPELALNEQ